MGVCSQGPLRNSFKGGLEKGHLSLWELRQGNLERGSFARGLKVTKGRLWRWAFHFTGVSWTSCSGLIYRGLYYRCISILHSYRYSHTSHDDVRSSVVTFS